MTDEGYNSFYIAGPMRGHPRFNFDAFDSAAKSLRADGFTVLSPHEHDLDCGFEPDDPNALDTFDLHDAFAWDVESIGHVDAVLFLPGWRKSQGAQIEYQIAQMFGKPCYEYETGLRIDSESILDEASRIVSTDRNVDYGPPHIDFAATAVKWTVVFGKHIWPHEVALAMAELKISRSSWSPDKRDNSVDLAGYADCHWRVVQETKKQNDGVMPDRDDVGAWLHTVRALGAFA